MFQNRLIALLVTLIPIFNSWAGVTTGSYAQTKRVLPACNIETNWEESVNEYFETINKLPEKEQVPALKKEVKELRKKLHEITKKAEIKDPKL